MIEKADWRKEKRKTGGSIKTINGIIYARVQYIDESTGKRKEKLKPASNRTNARELIKEMRRELGQSGQAALESDKLTFKQVAEKYQKIKLIAPVFQNGIKVTGVRSYKKQISLMKPLKEFFGSKGIRTIKPSDLEAYKAKRLHTLVVIEKNVKKANPKKEHKKFIWEKVKFSSPRSIASVNRELSLLRQVFVFAEAEDIILRNPFAKANKIISTAAEVQRNRVLSTVEENSLLHACENEHRRHIRPLVITALDTAARRGELLKLQWKDIDLLQGVIIIQATNTKTEKPRKIGMTMRIKDELNKLWENSPKDKKGLVFGIKSDFKRAWHSALKEANITEFHFHDLRHSAITRMIQGNVSISEAMKVSGHSEMKTFQRYVNLTNESVTVSANLLDSFNATQQTKIQTETASEMVN